MDSRKAVLFLAAAVVFLAAAMPQTAGAVDLIVEQNPTDPTHFSDIQAAINNAVNILTINTGTTIAYNVLVEPGTYSRPFTMQSNISVRGRETARTILTGGGSGPMVTANNVTGTVNFQNFTIINASPGITVVNSAVNITNNVFTVGQGGTAIQMQSSPSAAVINNTFFQNGIAVSRDTDAIRIINNIFNQNTTAISQASVATENNISNNAYFLNAADGPKGTLFIPNGTTVTSLDPLFVDPANRDFHLKAGSPCINNGSSTIIDKIDATQSDIGAYGGPNEDAIPFPVSNVTAVQSQTDTSTVTVSWNVNPDYQVAGYRVYYGKSSGNYTGADNASEGPSPITVAGPTEASQILSGLSATITTPATPVLDPLQVLNGSLGIRWSDVGVTTYKIYYSKTPFDASTLLPDTFVVVDNATSYTLPGLTNGQSYYVAVSAIAQAGLFVAVTAYDTRGEVSTTQLVPGQADESAFSQEVKVGSGAATEGAISAVQHDFPDELITNPNLVNRRVGCFIATAAYGHYSAPQVQALRDFRDQYLLTNGPGRTFVAWYYTNGPLAAEWLNAHPGYKPFVRAALLPAVGVSLFMTEAPFAFLIGLLLTASGIVSYMFYRRRSLRAGGPR